MDRVSFRDEISKNKRDSFILIVVIFLVFVLFGWIVSMAFEPGYFFIIMIIAIIFSLSYILISYYNSAKIAIASVGAKKAYKDDYKEYHDLVEGIAIASGLPKPELYVMHSQNINAFASGRDPDNAVICFTDGALEKLEKRELEGVISHEMSHIANYDMRFMTLVAVMVGMVAIASEIFLRSLWFSRGGNDKSKILFLILGIVLAILAPIVVWLVQMTISRRREFAADASAVKFTRYPGGLVGALKKIKYENAQPEKKVTKAVSHLFFANPLKGWGSTHPPLDKRIDRLEKM